MSDPNNKTEKPCLDMLHLSTSEVETINRELDQFGGADPGAEHGCEQFFPYRRSTKLVVTVYHPGGNTARFLTVPRNLSRAGIGVLHGGFIYTGTKLTITLETLNHKNVSIPGVAVSCRLIRGRVHLVGIRFNQPIDLAQFIFNSSDEGWAENLPKLTGRVLCVDGEQNERKILRVLLDRLGVRSEGCDSASEIADHMRKQTYDLVFVDIDRQDPFDELLEKVHQSAGGLPIIAVTVEEGDNLSERLLTKHRCNGTLTKPLDAAMVAQMLLQYLPLADENSSEEEKPGTIYSLLWSDRSLRGMICHYLDDLDQQLGQLDKLMVTPGNGAAIAKICQKIRGAAGSYGFPQISAAATDLRYMVEAGESTESLKPKYSELRNVAGAATASRDEFRRSEQAQPDAA